jgi:hypothetical protein
MSFHTRASSEFSTESQSSHPNEENEENEGIDGPKRKGGRKPVRILIFWLNYADYLRNSRLLQENREIAMHKQHSVSAGLSISKSSRRRSNCMAISCGQSRLLVVVPRTNASCSDTKTLSSKKFYCIKVGIISCLSTLKLIQVGIDVNLELDSKSWMTHPNPNLVPTPAIELKRRRLAQPRSKTGWLTRDAISSSKIDHVPRNSAFSRTPPPSSTSPGPKPAKQQKSFHTVTKDPKLSGMYPFLFTFFYFKRAMVLD